jgi:CHAD domain-containing protein
MVTDGPLKAAHVPPDGKWVHGLSANMRVGKAARRIFDARFTAMREALPPAAAWGPDPEPVHRLRVATRRAAAALDAFADLLPGKTYQSARRELRRVRRAAGAARDADVFLDGVRGWSVHQSPAARPGLHFLLGHALARRETAQVGLAAAVQEASGRTVKLFARLPDQVHGGRKERLSERATPTIAGRLGDLAAAAIGSLDDDQRLHQVRIAAKRLRYSLELFIDCFPPAVKDQLYPRVDAVQDVLGQANDFYQATQHLDALLAVVRQTQPALWELVRGGVEELRATVGQRLRDQRASFADWWRRWQMVPADAMLTGLTPPASSAAAPPAFPARGPTGV